MAKMVTLEYVGSHAMELWSGVSVGRKDKDGNPVGISSVKVTEAQADELLERDKVLKVKRWKRAAAKVAPDKK